MRGVRVTVGYFAIVLSGVLAVWSRESGLAVAALLTSGAAALAAVISWRSIAVVRGLRLLCGGVAGVLGALVSLLVAAASQPAGLVGTDRVLFAALPWAVMVAAFGAWTADLAVAANADREAATRHAEVLEKLREAAGGATRSVAPILRMRLRDLVLAAVLLRLLPGFRRG